MDHGRWESWPAENMLWFTIKFTNELRKKLELKLPAVPQICCRAALQKVIGKLYIHIRISGNDPVAPSFSFLEAISFYPIEKGIPLAGAFNTRWEEGLR